MLGAHIKAGRRSALCPLNVGDQASGAVGYEAGWGTRREGIEQASSSKWGRFRQVRRAEPTDPVNSVKTQTLQAVRPPAADTR
jgi:hypothetical protein